MSTHCPASTRSSPGTFYKPVWSSSRIQTELLRLDHLTGLNGASKQIRFFDSEKTLGRYSSHGIFSFSNFYFQNPSWPAEEAIDTIRHEYAHYMDNVRYGCMGHGETWKKCCMEIGARPEQYYHSIRKAAAAERSMTEGSFIEHPAYGKGWIQSIQNFGNSDMATIIFPGLMPKYLNMYWVKLHCKLTSFSL